MRSRKALVFARHTRTRIFQVDREIDTDGVTGLERENYPKKKIT